MTVTDARRDWTDEAVHSAYLEGLLVSAEFSEDSEDYVAGEITAEELVRRTRERYGIA